MSTRALPRIKSSPPRSCTIPLSTYTSAGKTGTSQVIGIKQNERYDAKRIAERHRDHSLYVAFAPLEAPKIALAVIVENGGFGAQAAAPIARKVFDHHLLNAQGRP
ncbi:MAG: hypothetical protein EBT99_09615 [Betaproteobacteria bacterium]|nr:hypothetical protein [Betaproteobacteria bacterium]